MSGVADAVARILDRELESVARELESYPDEESLWRTAPGITNSGGVLANHVSGNLLHFVGAVLGDTGYVRDRSAEFEQHDVPRSQLLVRIERARVVVGEVLPDLEPHQISDPYPDPPGSMEGIGTGAFLLHLVSHLSYHRGQLNYHRRILSSADAAG